MHHGKNASGLPSDILIGTKRAVIAPALEERLEASDRFIAHPLQFRWADVTLRRHHDASEEAASTIAR